MSTKATNAITIHAANSSIETGATFGARTVNRAPNARPVPITMPASNANRSSATIAPEPAIPGSSPAGSNAPPECEAPLAHVTVLGGHLPCHDVAAARERRRLHLDQARITAGMIRCARAVYAVWVGHPQQFDLRRYLEAQRDDVRCALQFHAGCRRAAQKFRVCARR